MNRLLLISPKSPESFWSLTGLRRLSGRDGLTPPLGLATLAALTPENYGIRIVDENIDPIDYDVPCDLVGITGYTVHREGMVEIAREFRKRGKLVVGGGPFCSSHREEAASFLDVVIAGEAERAWPRFLADWENGEHLTFYEEEEKIDLSRPPQTVPRWDLIDLGRYLVGMVQTSRGCPHDCEFCDVVSLFGRKTRHKTIEHVIAELRAVREHGAMEVFFADDNFVGNRRYTKQLLEALIDLNRSLKKPLRFLTQVTLDSAEDDELLDALKRANFTILFIGIETPKKESLALANKHHNVKVDMVDSVRRIQSRGLVVIPGMIVGFDSDDLDIFRMQEEFLKEAGLMFPMLGMLVAFRGTRLWTRMEREGRLTSTEFGDVFMPTNILPKQMTKEQLEENYLRLLQRVFSEAFFKQAFQHYMNQIDVAEIRRDSWVIRALDFRTIPFFYTLYGIRILWTFLIGSRADRSLLFSALRMALGKHLYCLPLCINALAYFKALNSFVERKTRAFHLGSTATPALPLLNPPG